MKIGKQFNALTYSEYLQLIERYEKFTDFNTLGLFRSIVEASKLSLEQKLKLRKLAIDTFPKAFDFLQVKGPLTYFRVNTLGEVLTIADERQAWETIRYNQQAILKCKKLKHRNFGIYGRHNCGYDTCPIKGVMFKQPSLSAASMYFHSDKDDYAAQTKAEMRKKDRKAQRQLVAQNLDSE